MYIPEGFGTVFPYMIVDDVDGFVEFLTAVFDASVVGKTERPGGRIANMRIRIGTSTFMVSQAGDNAMAAMPGTYYVFVEDVDTTYERALAKGAQSVFEPADMPYEDRQAGVTDASGNIWWVSKRLVEKPYDA